MLERFTRGARTVVTTAVEDARRSGAGSVRPEHLLSAVLVDVHSPAVQALAGLGAPVSELRQVVAGLRGRYGEGLDAADAEALRSIGIDLDDVVRLIDAGPGSRRGRVRLSADSRRVLELALGEAVRLRERFIGSEHLLLGLVTVDDSLVQEVLRAFDLTSGEVCSAVAGAERRTG